MHKTLIVTNDFPPRPGGIQAFLHNMALRLDPERLVVYASTWKRSREGIEATAAFDAEQPFTVVRDRTTMLLPTPRVTRRAVSPAARTRLLLGVVRGGGAARPHGARAARAGAERLVATTHGHEAGWAQLPAARQLLRRIGEGTDTITYLGEYTRSRIAGALTPQAAARMVQLPPGVDEKTFHPGSGGDAVRARLGLADRPVVVCVSRLVPRKGQDTLILAMPAILAQVPDAVLLIVGGGPYEADLRELARGHRGLGLRPLHRGGALGGAARALRRGRRLRDAVPHPARRPGRRGPRHRLPGGLGDRPARGGGRLGRRARRGARRRDGLGGAGRLPGGLRRSAS